MLRYARDRPEGFRIVSLRGFSPIARCSAAGRSHPRLTREPSAMRRILSAGSTGLFYNLVDVVPAARAVDGIAKRIAPPGRSFRLPSDTKPGAVMNSATLLLPLSFSLLLLSCASSSKESADDL